MNSHKLNILIVSMLLSFALQSCRDYSEEKAQAHAEWERHRRIVREYIDGQRDDVQEFEDSLIFFDSLHELTGVNVRVNISGALGLVFFNDETIADMKKIDTWYEENKGQIIWDAESKQMILLK